MNTTKAIYSKTNAYLLPNKYRRMLGVAALSIVFTTSTYAQDNAGFADDFSTDSTRLNGGAFDNAGGPAVFEQRSDGVGLQAESDSLDAPASLFLEANNEPGRFGIDITQRPSTIIDGDGISTVFLEARVFSNRTLQENRFNPPGTIDAQIAYNVNREGSSSANFCVFETQDDGNSQPIGDGDEQFCGTLASLDSGFDIRRSIDIVADLEARSIVFSIDGTSRTVIIPGDEPLFEPAQNFRRMQLWSFNTVGTVRGTLHTMRIADETINFADTVPTFTQYRALFDVDNIQRFSSVENGMLRLTARATEENNFRNRLQLAEPTDYLEATLTLSSESTLDVDGRVRASIEMFLYNDLADGGTDGQTGDVVGFIEAEIRVRGRSSLEYCLARRDTPDGNNDRGLLDNGERCGNLPVSVQFDQPLRVSMALDRDNGTVTFRVDDQVHVQAVDGPFFQASELFLAVAAASSDLANTVMLVDDLRTSEASLTNTETATGIATPPAFPEPAGPPAPADNTLTYPLPDEAPALDFIDDFSNPSVTHFGLETNSEEGTYGVASIPGAIRLESTQIEGEPICCADVRLKSSGRSDSVSARVSISSESNLPIESSARARVMVRSQLWNNTQDFGLDDEVGDVTIEMFIELRGDGERNAEACARVRTSDDNDEQLDMFNGDNCMRFATLPQFDEQYTLAMSIDRQTSILSLSINEETVEVDIGGTAFLPNVQRIEVGNRHEGSSGRAVGLVHAISTDNFTDDFAGTIPLFAPYRPLFATQQNGATVTVDDERLRLTHDSAINADNRPRFVSRSPSEFVAATLEISSESRVVTGSVDVSVGGHLYNDIADGGINDDEGAVFAIAGLVANGDGELFIEYCGIRSNTDNFSDTTQIVSSDTENCPRFDTPLLLDTPYRMSIALDRERGVIVFGLNDQTREHPISTGIFTPSSYFQGIRANSRDGSAIVAFADDLAFTANAVPLADSQALVGTVVVSNDTAEPVVDPTEADPVVTPPVVTPPAVNPIDDATGGSSSSSSDGLFGCSIAGGSGGLQAPLFLVFALLAIRRLRKR